MIKMLGGWGLIKMECPILFSAPLPTFCFAPPPLARDVFESRTETGSEHFACQDSGLSQIFKLIVSTSEKILNNVKEVV